MRTRTQVQELLYGALLAALAILIPTVFRGWLQVIVPPFSATLGSHVPTMLAMFISPMTAALVGVGSALGFLLTLGPIVALRAAVHILIGVMGARLTRRGKHPWLVLSLTALPHAVGESLVVLPFGFDLYQAFVVVGLGTLLHHSVDAVLTVVLNSSLAKAGVKLNKLVPDSCDRNHTMLR
ncbi:MAG: ECF transporter S component [Firmicutes bacterium]|jgi:niacin transporter|nr:ECF transporter S component [Bacillota bacterium]